MIEISPETHAVRMGVKGGGCSGLTYTLDFDDKQRKFDILYESNGLNILVDKKSNLYIKSTEIDWSYNLMDRGLKFNNPQAKGSCGCKTSFMIDMNQQWTSPHGCEIIVQKHMQTCNTQKKRRRILRRL